MYIFGKENIVTIKKIINKCPFLHFYNYNYMCTLVENSQCPFLPFLEKVDLLLFFYAFELFLAE